LRGHVYRLIRRELAAAPPPAEAVVPDTGMPV
jgi:hypothetical protein